VDVILTKTVPKLGLVGEVVEVAEGYARNYLLPKGVAVKASGHEKMALANKVKSIRDSELKEKANAQALAARLAGVSVNVEVKTHDEGKIFGSVKEAEIHEALKGIGFDLDKRMIELKEPIKKIGVYDVTLKLHALVQSEIKVWVIRESESK